MTEDNTKTNSIDNSLKLIPVLQIVITILFGIVLYFFQIKEFARAVIFAGMICFIYSMLLKLSSKNSFFVLFGSFLRIVIIAIPAAILIHKLQLNLLGIFCGFVICQIIYLVIMFNAVKSGKGV